MWQTRRWQFEVPKTTLTPRAMEETHQEKGLPSKENGLSAKKDEPSAKENDTENGLRCTEKGLSCTKKGSPSKETNSVLVEITKGQPSSEQKQRITEQRKRRRFAISYEVVVWVVFFIVTVLCVVDHFVKKGDIVLKRSGKLPSNMWGTNLGETITNVVWAITARIIITSQNLMFYTTLWCFPNFLCEIAPRWVTMEGIRDVHLRMHTFAGIFLIAIPSLAHVLVIFVPPLIDGTSLKYYPPSTFNYSNSLGYMNWTKPWDPAAVENWTFNDHTGVHLTADEIYRFTLMIVLFCFFFPLSRSIYVNKRSYSIAMALHVVAGIWYSVDNIRKITHGLAHFVNLPMLIFWCIDRLLSIYFYRSNNGRVVMKEIVGNNEYIVVYVKLNKTVKRAVGDIYYILHQIRGSTGLTPQRSHPFTTFSNLSKDSTWDIGLVISVMEDKEQVCLPWTSWYANTQNNVAFNTWGPYRSSMWSLSNELANASQGNQTPSHYVLLATGSGCGYLLDALSTLAYKTPSCPKSNTPIKINIVYSVRCKGLYNFLHKPFNDLLKKIKEKNVADITLQVYVTSKDVEDTTPDMEESDIQLIYGRADFEKVLNGTSETACCYFVGRPAIAEDIEHMCKKRRIRLVKDYTDGRGKGSDRRLLIKYLKISFWLLCFIVFICVVMRLVVDLEDIQKSLKSNKVNVTM